MVKTLYIKNSIIEIYYNSITLMRKDVLIIFIC